MMNSQTNEKGSPSPQIPTRLSERGRSASEKASGPTLPALIFNVCTAYCGPDWVCALPKYHKGRHSPVALPEGRKRGQEKPRGPVLKRVRVGDPIRLVDFSESSFKGYFQCQRLLAFFERLGRSYGELLAYSPKELYCIPMKGRGIGFRQVLWLARALEDRGLRVQESWKTLTKR